MLLQINVSSRPHFICRFSNVTGLHRRRVACGIFTEESEMVVAESAVLIDTSFVCFVSIQQLTGDFSSQRASRGLSAIAESLCLMHSAPSNVSLGCLSSRGCVQKNLINACYRKFINISYFIVTPNFEMWGFMGGLA